MTLYHGSDKSGLTILDALSLLNAIEKSPVVYLTPNRTYALFYIRDPEVNYVTCGVTTDGYIRYDERFLDQLAVCYKGRSGYLYKCIDNGTIEITKTRDVLVSMTPVTVDSFEFIPDVYSEISKHEETGKIKVNRYHTLTDEEKQGIFEMIVVSLYKSQLTVRNTKKACFYRDNFPEAWEYVRTHPEKKEDFINMWNKNIIK